MSSLTSTANGYFQIVTPTPSGPGGAALNSNFEQADAELEAIYGALADKADVSDLSELTFAGLADTRITSPALGDVLAYVPAFSSWANVKPDAAGLATTTVLNSGLANLIPRGHLAGLTLSNNTADPNNDIDITPGEAVDEGRSYLMRLAAPITKRLDAAWSAGSGNGGLFSGSKAANTWYHVHLIRRDSDGVIDVGFDTNVTAANRPVGWSAYRRLSSMVLTDASGNIRPFIQNGDRFEFTVPIVDLAVTGSQPTTATLLTLSTPPGLSVEVLLQLIARDTTRDGGYIRLWHGNTATVPGAGDVYSFSWTTDTGNLQVAELSGLMTSTASQIRYWSQYPNAEIGIRTRGWIDRRGRG